MLDHFITILQQKKYIHKTPPHQSRYETYKQSVLTEKNTNLNLKNISKSDLKKINIKLPKQKPSSAQVSKVLHKTVTHFQSDYKRRFSKYEILNTSIQLPSLNQDKIKQLELQLMLIRTVYEDRLQENQTLKQNLIQKDIQETKLQNFEEYNNLKQEFANQKAIIKQQKQQIEQMSKLQYQQEELKKRKNKCIIAKDIIFQQIQEVKENKNKIELEKTKIQNELAQMQAQSDFNQLIVNEKQIEELKECLNSKFLSDQQKRKNKIKQIKILQKQIYYQDALFTHQKQQSHNKYQ